MAANKEQSSFHILVCMIKIWKPNDIRNTNEEPEDALYVTEVENIEIEESYRKLIGTASVRFPRGTIVRKTVTQTNQQEIADNPALSINVEDNGVVVTTRNYSKKAEVGDFSIGSRIKIWLGYTSDPKVADTFKITNKQSVHTNMSIRNQYIDPNYAQKCLTLMFNGYITKCSIDHPIEIKCENLASVLKKISCPDVTYKGASVNDLFNEDGGSQYHANLLKNTGLKLHPYTKSCEIIVGDIELNTHLTVADVLTTWTKSGVVAFLKEYNGEPCIAVGRSYFSNAGNDSIVKYQDESGVPQILFDYHVADNGLTLTNTELLFLAVEATALDSQGKFYHITIRLNPEWDGKSNNNKYQVLNEVTISKKAQQMGATVLSKCKGNNRVDLSSYTILPYMSKKMGVSHEELLEEAIKYFESCNQNGIEGTLTLFGDLALRTGSTVELVDNRYPAKNGYYFVDEVYTTFGVGGYRQKIKLPYCISRGSAHE